MEFFCTSEEEAQTREMGVTVQGRERERGMNFGYFDISVGDDLIEIFPSIKSN